MTMGKCLSKPPLWQHFWQVHSMQHLLSSAGKNMRAFDSCCKGSDGFTLFADLQQHSLPRMYF
ncbi:hypothetical protein POPTR_003G142301v4 [Populus trichocarpa]|uniref:Uncharacterized protein n=1 Tax=Populus trichocarpa TaxID=3694 RepID=A0ACC0T9P1_POPTR|nr:hypothetical protein BDE02_03G129300 [Populus trichocarpa]KAI9398192.1 hypothetical protein POPTR_003G142301v4 [Populus trichocarpa]